MFTIRTRRRRCTGLLALALTAPLAAKESVHQHGVVSLDVALDAKMLTLQLEAPLDSLLGFEHRPRTAAQRSAPQAMLKQIGDGAALFRPDAAALCTLSRSSVASAVLEPAAPSAPAGKDGPDARPEGAHADLDAAFEFTCQQPDKLSRLQIGLFDAFKRIQRIEVQLALPGGQSKQTLQRPQGTLRLAR